MNTALMSTAVIVCLAAAVLAFPALADNAEAAAQLLSGRGVRR